MSIGQSPLARPGSTQPTLLKGHQGVWSCLGMQLEHYTGLGLSDSPQARKDCLCRLQLGSAVQASAKPPATTGSQSSKNCIPKLKMLYLKTKQHESGCNVESSLEKLLVAPAGTNFSPFSKCSLTLLTPRSITFFGMVQDLF